mgnify:CR=1 FL=1
MKEPKGIYSIKSVLFDSSLSKVQNLIMMQGAFALEATIARIDYLNKICGPKNGNNIFTDRNIPYLLQDLCAQAGIASQVLFNGQAKKGFKESEIAFELRLERYNYVKNLCEIHSFEPEVLNDRRVRNSLTHIDEKMADLLTKESDVAWFVDHAASIRNSFQMPAEIKSVKFCRTYIHNESKILHLDNELDLDKLRKECLKTLTVVFNAKSIH